MILTCLAVLPGFLLFLSGCKQHSGKGELPDSSATSIRPVVQAAAPAPISPPPTGISAEEDGRIPPGPPGTVRVTQQDQKHLVEWQGTRDDTIKGYQVYSKSTNRGDWKAIGFVKLREDDLRNRGNYQFKQDVEPGCEYAVAAVGLGGKAGPKNVETK